MDTDKIVKYFDAHSDSERGISSIIELKEPSYLLRGERGEPDPEVRYLVTAAFDKKEFKIWKMRARGAYNRPEFNFHIKIDTTLHGIASVIQSTPDQLVCVDNEKTLKFYDFVDRAEQKKEEDFQAAVASFNSQLMGLFKQIDKDDSGELDVAECEPLACLLIESDKQEMSVEEKTARCEALYSEMDYDKSGYVSCHELKVFLTRKFIELNKQ